MRKPSLKYPLLEWIFYGNYFYGICAVAQSIEATLQQKFPLAHWFYYCLVFVATVLYYNYPYARRYKPGSHNPRTAWYARHYKTMFWSQVIFTVVLIAAGFVILYQYGFLISSMHLTQWVLLAVFPVVAGLYYGLNFFSNRYNLRSIGWAKPFIIGFAWSGLVTIYPILWHNIQNQQPYLFTQFGTLLFIKNLMFVAMLCIMFDIKDYATDHGSRLKTFVVRLGLRKTLLYVLIPLPILGLFTFITYALTHQFSVMKTAINMIPFVLLLLTAYALRKRRSMMYYHVVIDGLMLVKAACGITAMLFF
ncbi:MAG: hypothetical protein EOP53_11105 [Sphingobacteriales bacterium]|nr:MAG: hypothetical protein EOP53_11105 [Sphingobacteriales bacterium]